MIDLNRLIQLFLILSFLLYGASCFLSTHISQEFRRFQMSRWRRLTGALQIASCLGLVLGFYVPIFTSLSALLLTVMMLVALAVRIRLRDTALMTAPAIIYFLLSLFLLITSLK